MNVERKLLAGMALCVLAASACVSSAAIAAQDAPVSASSVGAQSDEKQADQKIYGCVEGYADLLPGEYYACRAKYYFQRKHYGLAVERLKDAAHWANKDAQYTLGVIYFNGDLPDVPANRPLALAWLALAAERKKSDYVQMYAIVRQQSSAAELEQGGVLWQKMSREYGDRVAGLRALRRFNHEVQPLEDAANSGGIAYLNGYSPFPETANKIVADVHAAADRAFDGLVGTVTVGSLQTK